MLYTWVFTEQPFISGICDVRNSKGDMAHRAESNNTDKLPWTSPGSFKNKKKQKSSSSSLFENNIVTIGLARE